MIRWLLFYSLCIIIQTASAECPFMSKDLITEDFGAIGRNKEAELCANSDRLKREGKVIKRGTPEHGHYMNVYKQEQIGLYHNSLAVIQATLAYKDSLGYKYGSSPNNFLHYLMSAGYIAGPYKQCAAPVYCPKYSNYRTIDGSCNNLKYIRWGQATTSLNRLLPPAYSDGVQAPRKSVSGYDLPLARVVSAVLFDDVYNPDPEWTVLFMQFGQYLTHDIALSPTAHYGDTQGIQCCEPDGSGVLPPDMLHHACYPIIIPYDDPFFWKWNQRCMNFVRTMTVAHPDCRLGPAEQMNAVSHWLDLSTVYGSNDAQSHGLRTHEYGLLDHKYTNGHMVLPSAEGKGDGYACDDKCPSGICYKAGDIRVNQNLGLASLHIIYLRLHNHIATELYKINPHWDDEYLYQEARKICIAVYQKIVYYEYLPIALGWDYCVAHNLIVPPGGSYGSNVGYNDYVSPNIINEFTAGAFRYLHSTIHGYSELYDSYYNLNSTTRLSEHFNCPAVLESAPHLVDYYVRGMCTKLMESGDPWFTHEVTWHLFASGKPYGLDLESFDIQRSRDHGLRPYNDYRALCGLPRAYSFDDLLDVMRPESVAQLKSLYAHVDDLDLTVAFLERHQDDSQFGPTLRCITGEQFYRTRVGDRFFFEHRGMKHSFNDYQIAAIHKYKFAKLLCEHSDYMPQIQPDVFKRIYGYNELVDCASMPGLDLSLWKSEPTY